MEPNAKQSPFNLNKVCIALKLDKFQPTKSALENFIYKTYQRFPNADFVIISDKKPCNQKHTYFETQNFWDQLQDHIQNNGLEGCLLLDNEFCQLPSYAPAPIKTGFKLRIFLEFTQKGNYLTSHHAIIPRPKEWADGYSLRQIYFFDKSSIKALHKEPSVMLQKLIEDKQVEGLPIGGQTIAGSQLEKINQHNIKPCLFLDRDGVLIQDTGYPHKIGEVIFRDSILPILQQAKDWGWYLVVVSNQAGIAKKIFTN